MTDKAAWQTPKMWIFILKSTNIQNAIFVVSPTVLCNESLMYDV